MATIKPTITTLADGTAIKAVWTPMIIIDTDPGAPVVYEYDIGSPIEFARFSDRSIQVTGTWGVGGSITLQGSNDGTNYYALTDPQGNAITKTANALEQVSELTQYIKPEITAGDITTSLTVTMILKLPQPLRM